MASRKEYTPEQQAEYYKKKFLELSKGGKPARKKRTGTAAARSTSRRKGRKSYGTRKGTAKRASGCIYYNSYRGKDGSIVNEPKIFAWRYFGSGRNRRKMVMNAYLSKDGGKPQNGTSMDVCVCFVANVTIVGESEKAYSAVWSQQYEKLTISALSLVANPKLAGGGYFGKGGSAYKSKVK